VIVEAMRPDHPPGKRTGHAVQGSRDRLFRPATRHRRDSSPPNHHLAARTEQGKTALALNICEHVICERSRPAAFRPPLRNGRTGAGRAVALGEGKPPPPPPPHPPQPPPRPTVSTRHKNSARKKRAADSRTWYSRPAGLPASLHPFQDGHRRHPRPGTCPQITARTNGFKLPPGTSAIVVDYIQIVDAEASRDSPPGADREDQPADQASSPGDEDPGRSADLPASTGRRRTARTVEKAMADLRKRGHRADADLVLLLHRPEYYDANGPDGRRRADPAKKPVRRDRQGRLFAFLKNLPVRGTGPETKSTRGKRRLNDTV